MLRLLPALVAAVLLSGTLAGEELPRWRSLFNGKDTSGWTYCKQKGEWQVVDGLLTQRDKYDYCTVDELSNYLLEIDFKSKPEGGGNSGVYLRGQVEVQILNSTYRKGDSKKLGTGDGGAIYGVGPPLVNAHNPQGEWNHYRILHLGNSVTVWLNGVIVQDGADCPKPTPGSISKHPVTGRALTIDRGPLMLQGDHDIMYFRNIRVLELPEGWKPLWNGKDMSELTMRNEERDARLTEFWTIDGDAFYNPRWGYQENRGWDIWTKKPYGNFLVHYEYRSDPTKHAGNSGFYLRNQWEIQIERNQGTDNKHGDGALYSIKAPDVAAKKEDRRAWNVIDAKCVQNRVWVWQNGQLIHDGVPLSRRTDSKQATKEFSKDAFKFQGDHGQVWFRNLFIKELPDDAR